MAGTKATPRWLRSEKEGLTQRQTPACIIIDRRRKIFRLFQEKFYNKGRNQRELQQVFGKSCSF
jgi:hypothetical protein